MKVLTLKISLMSEHTLAYALTTLDPEERIGIGTIETDPIPNLLSLLKQGFHEIKLAVRSGSADGWRTVGGKYSSFLLPQSINILMCQRSERFLILDLDEVLVSFVWEALTLLDGSTLSERFAVGRNLRVLGQRPNVDKNILRSPLIAADPRGDLASAGIEGAAVYSALQPHSSGCTYLNASISRLDFASHLENSSFLHYSGHSDIDQMCLLDGDFKSSDINNCKHIPFFVFLNSCSPIDADGWLQGHTNLVRAFLRNGTYILICPISIIDSQAATIFAKLFYNHFLSGKTAGESLKKASQELEPQKALYVLYGNPLFQIHVEPIVGVNKKLEERSTRKTQLWRIAFLLASMVLLIGFFALSHFGSHIKGNQEKDSASVADLSSLLNDLGKTYLKSDCPNVPQLAQREAILKSVLSQLANLGSLKTSQLLQEMIEVCGQERLSLQKAEELGLNSMKIEQLKDFFLNHTPGLESQKRIIMEQMGITRDMMNKHIGSQSAEQAKFIEKTYEESVRKSIVSIISKAHLSHTDFISKKDKLNIVAPKAKSEAPIPEAQPRNPDPLILAGKKSDFAQKANDASSEERQERPAPKIDGAVDADKNFQLALEYLLHKSPTEKRRAKYFLKIACYAARAKGLYCRNLGDRLYLEAESEQDIDEAILAFERAVALGEIISKPDLEVLKRYREREKIISTLQEAKGNTVLDSSDVDIMRIMSHRYAQGCPSTYHSLPRVDARGDLVMKDVCPLFDEVKPDEQKSYYWLNKIQEIGQSLDLPKDSGVLFEMAEKHHFGRTGPINYQEAVAWYKKAALAGSSRAALALGEIFRTNIYKKDLNESHRWLHVAVRTARGNTGLSEHASRELESFHSRYQLPFDALKIDKSVFREVRILKDDDWKLESRCEAVDLARFKEEVKASAGILIVGDDDDYILSLESSEKAIFYYLDDSSCS